MTNLKEKGFTLIELMIVVAIIGILAAIAIPQFSAFKEKANDASAASDVGTLKVGEEMYFTDNNVYLAVAGTVDTTGVAAAANVGSLDGAVVSKATSYAVGVNAAATSFSAFACNNNGSKNVYGNFDANIQEVAKKVAACTGTANKAVTATYMSSGTFAGTAY